MRRRELIILIGGAASVVVCSPLVALAQQAERVRRIGILIGLAENDPEQRSRFAAFRQALERFGWIEERNIRLDTRYAVAGAHAEIGRAHV